MRRIGMVGILNNPATSLNSHSAGWNEVMRKIIADQHKCECHILSEKDDWDSYDQLVINHGPNFKPGSFNIVGGISLEVIARIEKLIDYALFGPGIIVQIDGFQFDDFVEKRRIGARIGIHQKMMLYKYDKTLIGDSHSISVWPGPGWNIDRRDGKTLYGFLKEPDPADFLYFGNIDIRFHLPRMKNPLHETLNLALRYIEFAKYCGAKVSCLLPVESESRKMPGTGLYKKHPFFGSQKLRSELVDAFNCELLMSDLEVHQWPSLWYRNLNHYETDVMEPRQSVHIRPKYYANKS